MSTRHKTVKSTSSSGSERLILLTGASGYVGSRLLRALESEGHSVRRAGRRPEAIATGAPKTTVARADVLDRESIDAAMRGIDTAYYLVHSMNSERSFESADREGARNFAEAARAAGVRRIIYLGGLGYSSGSLSRHLRSRQEVGELLRASGTQVVESALRQLSGAGAFRSKWFARLPSACP